MSVRFDASKSFDIDGTVASYEWDFGDYDSPRNSADTAVAAHTYAKPGAYFGKITIRDAADGESQLYFGVYVQADTPTTFWSMDSRS